MTKRHTLW